jgi:hypothetical protein
MSAKKDSTPTTCTSALWIYARSSAQGCYEDGRTFVGKWLVFVPCENVDKVWSRIARATEHDLLGISAKVSTAVPNGYDASRHLICVYTNDFRQKDDVARVLNALREIGIIGKLYYKTDEATLSGLYSSNGPFTKKKGRASLYCSDDFES